MKSRVGFISDGMIPSLKELFWGRCGVRGLILGRLSSSSVAMMRGEWLIDAVNACEQNALQYEFFRPWLAYDAIVFVKSMGDASAALQQRLKMKGVSTLFDANVDYFTTPEGHFFYDGMVPTPEQRAAAIEMATLCDGVMADSQHIKGAAEQYNRNVVCVTDNVKDDLITQGSSWRPSGNSKIPLLWSGEAVKLFDLLRIKEVLLDYAKKFRLVLVTSSLQALERWFPPYRKEFDDLLSKIEHQVMPFVSIRKLMRIYDDGGVSISPRFLDNTYNLGHTEWKITLAMARGRIAVCSDQPSYVDVAVRAKDEGIRICRSDDAWRRAFDEILDPGFDWDREQTAASAVVKKYYATSVVADEHVRFVSSILEGQSRDR